MVVINGTYDLGELLVQGEISPDEFIVFKPTLAEGKHAIIEKKLGNKTHKLAYGHKPDEMTKHLSVEESLRDEFCLSDKQVLKLARWVVMIEKHYTGLYGRWSPMDVEWAFDGLSRELFIVQVRPETIHANKSLDSLTEFVIKDSDRNQKLIFEAIAVGDKIGQEKVNVIHTLDGRDGSADETEFFVEKLSFGIAHIGAAFYPSQVIVRFSDFKSNEYRNLLGGIYFEPEEENPMIGWRGASRYYSEKYKEAFGLECKAIKRVREVFLMAELPSNIILAEDFAKQVDGFSIGSNDLTQLVLGLDRDSSLVAHVYDERNKAVKSMILMLLEKARKTGTKVGICGQGPSDFPDFAEFLVSNGIGSISVTPDSVLKTLHSISKLEKEIKEPAALK